MPGESLGMEQGREPQPYIVYGFKNAKIVVPLSEYILEQKKINNVNCLVKASYAF